MWPMWYSFNAKYALISRLLNIIYPSRCPVCKSKSDVFVSSPICSICWSQIRRYTGPSCKICAMPFSSDLSSICKDCIKKSPPFSKVINFGLYEGVLAEAINQLKFYGIKRISKPLAKLLSKLPIPVIDGIVPVPLHIKSLRERGFNQSLLLAIYLSKVLHVPILMDILIKKKETPPQIGLSAKERLHNIRSAFTVRGDVKGLVVLLVDDVMTTGATVTECSHELLKSGARDVFVLTLARTLMS